MNILKKTILALAVGIIAVGGLTLGEQLLSSGMPELVSSAQARVGRPLTPVSVAGVARRTARRCANGTYNC